MLPENIAQRSHNISPPSKMTKHASPSEGIAFRSILLRLTEKIPHGLKQLHTLSRLEKIPHRLKHPERKKILKQRKEIVKQLERKKILKQLESKKIPLRHDKQNCFSSTGRKIQHRLKQMHRLK